MKRHSLLEQIIFSAKNVKNFEDAFCWRRSKLITQNIEGKTPNTKLARFVNDSAATRECETVQANGKRRILLRT